jgi:hypothetical protein
LEPDVAVAVEDDEKEGSCVQIDAGVGCDVAGGVKNRIEVSSG